MKKLFIKITGILIFCSLNIGINFAQQLSLPQTNACLNDTILVPINFSNIDSVGAFTLVISYDTAVLKYVGYSNVSTLTPGIWFGVPTVGLDAWKFVAAWVGDPYNTSGVNLTSGKICDIKFKYKGGSSNLTYSSSCELTKPDGLTSIFPTYLNGSISPTILSHPVSSIICESLQTSFSVTAIAGSTFQWQVQNGAQWDNIQSSSIYSGVNDDTLIVNQVPYSLNNKVYRCVVTKTCSQYSNTATLTVYPKPAIVINNDTTICSGNPVLVNGTGTTGTETLLYNWNQGLGLGIAHNVTPTTATTYKLTVTDANYCISTDSIIVNVLPLPTVAGPISGLTTVCQGQNSVTYSIDPLTNTTSYIWTLPTGASGTSTTNSITVNYSTSATSGNITVRGNNTCGNGSVATLPIRVNQLPLVSNNPTYVSCSGESFNLSLTSTIPCNFIWTIGTITGGITGAYPGSGTLISQVLTNPSNSVAGTVQYIVTPTSTTGTCVGTPFTITVTVNPTPIITNAATAVTCSGTSPNITLTSSVPSTFAWIIQTITGGISGTSNGNGPIINQVLTNPSNTTAGAVQYVVIPTSTTGFCTGIYDTITVTVNPAPAITNSTIASTCSGTSPNITLTATIPSSYAWTIGTITGNITGASSGSGAAINQILTNPSNTALGTVQYIVTPTSTSGTCVGAPFTITVTVNPTPVITNAASAVTCSGTSPNITLTSTIPSSYAWTIGTITGNITGASNGSGTTLNQILTNPSNTIAGTVQYIVTPTSTTGTCPGSSFIITVTVNPTPLVTNAATAVTCSGTSPNITLTSSVPSTFAWIIQTITGGISGTSNGNGPIINQVLTNPSNTTAGAVQYVVIPTSTTGFCTGIYDTIVVTVNPAPAITNSATSVTCSGTSPNITLTSSIPSSYAWTIGTNTGGITGASNGSGAAINQILTNPNTIAGSVQYVITPTSTTGTCLGASFTITVTVNPTPIITNSATAVTCSGTSPNITLTSSVPSSYTWTIGTNTGGITGASNGSAATINQVLTNPSNSAAGTVQYIVTPTSTTGTCIGNPYTITVTVNPTPIITNSATAVTCSGTSPNITLTSSVPSNYAWTIGTITGGITGASAGNGTAINQVLINPNMSVGTVQYFIIPTSTTGTCIGIQDTITVSVNPLPSSAGTITGTSNLCQGAINILYTVPVITNATSYTWAYSGTGITFVGGNSTITDSVIINFSNIATSGILTVNGHNSCGDGIVSANYSITINQLPYNTDTITGLQTVCQGQSSVNYFINVISNATSYIWTLPDGASGTSTTNSITVDYSVSAVSGYIVVKGSNICGLSDSSFFYINVNQPMVGAIGAINGANTVCQGQSSVTYKVPPIANATSYIWTLPSGATGTSVVDSIIVNYSNTALSGNIIVKGVNACGISDSAFIAITVNPLPSASGAITGLTTVCQGQTSVTYKVPPIANATSYIWTLPTGATGTSSLDSIIVNYSNTAISGIITVKGNNACGDGLVSANYAITVNPLPDAAGTITGSDTVGQEQNSVAFSVPAIANATSYIWEYSGAGATITGTTNNVTISFSVTATSGNLTVKGHNNCGDGVISANYPIYVSPVGITENDNSLNYSIFPNPTNGIVTIKIDGLAGNLDLQIVNIQGKVIRTEEIINNKQSYTQDIDLSIYPKGIYLVKLTNNNFAKVEKIVLQ